MNPAVVMQQRAHLLQETETKSERQQGAVAKCKTIFDLTADRPRSEAIQMAIMIAGVKKGTANTQYQHWKKRREEQSKGR